MNADGVAALYDAEQRAELDAAQVEYRDELFGYLRKGLGTPDAAADLTRETLRMMACRDALDVADRRLLMYRIAILQGQAQPVPAPCRPLRAVGRCRSAESGHAEAGIGEHCFRWTGRRRPIR